MPPSFESCGVILYRHWLAALRFPVKFETYPVSGIVYGPSNPVAVGYITRADLIQQVALHILASKRTVESAPVSSTLTSRGAPATIIDHLQ